MKNLFSSYAAAIVIITGAKGCKSNEATTPTRKSCIPLLLEKDSIVETNKINEQNYVWKEILNNCIGYWSGSISHFEFDKEGQKLVPAKERAKKLNFRLKVDIDENNQERGTWTVRNVMRVGDETTVPIARVPPKEMMNTSHKIGFENIIIRATRNKQVVIEIGFWDQGIRRTVVLTAFEDEDSSFEDKKVGFLKMKSRENGLTSLSLIQQKYLGNINPKEEEVDNYIDNDEYCNIMPDIETMMTNPFSASMQMKNKKVVDLFVPVKIESVNLDTYERKVNTNLQTNQVEDMKKVLDELGKHSNDKVIDETNSFRDVVANGIFTLLPNRFNKNGTASFYFAHQCIRNNWTVSLQIVEITYSMEPITAKSIIVYTFIKKDEKLK